MKRSTLWTLVPLLVANAALSLAASRPHLDIRELVSSSDVIAVADVGESIVSGPPTSLDVGGRTFPARRYSVRLLVRSVVKGVCPRELTVTYALPLEFAGFVRLQTGIRIVFLQKNAATYEPANPYFPDLPASGTGNSAVLSNDVDAISAVVFHELASVVGSATTSPESKLQVLQVSFAIPTDAGYFTLALKQGIDSAASQQLREALQSQLLMRGDVSEMTEVARVLMNNTVTPEGKSGLLYAIGNWVKDEQAVPTIVSLLSSSDPSIRVAATEALWHVRDPGTQTTLVRGLEDSSREVRYYAVRALAEITDQPIWGPSIPEFQEHEGRYVGYWRKWASEYLK